MNMKKSTFSFKINRKRYSIKITEEKNLQALINYLEINETNLQMRIKEWIKKVDKQRWNLKENKAWIEERLYKIKEKDTARILEAENNINFIQMEEIPEEIEHPWMDFLIQK